MVNTRYSEKDFRLEQSKFKAYMDEELISIFHDYKGDKNNIYFKALIQEIKDRNIEL